jgi:hypothetical protein
MPTEPGPHLLGRNKEHDPESRNFPAPVRRVARPVSVMHTCNAPILDQGELGSCVGNTGAEWLNCAKALRNRRRGVMVTRWGVPRHSYLNETDAVDLYAHATRRDEVTTEAYPPTDTGTSALGLGKTLQDLNFIDGYDWTFSFGALLAALALSPVCVGINWYASMYETDRAGYVTPVGTDPDGGHEILARGIDVALQRIRFRNHWTREWGLDGEFWMSFTVAERLIIHEEGDVMVPRLIAT